MPNFKTHAVIGGAAGFAAYCVKYNLEKTTNRQAKFDLGKAATWSAVGAFAASIPDWLEPAASPNHRGFFHSIFILAALFWFLLVVGTGTLSTIVLLVIAAVGYGSHLIADSFTPRSLPWI